MIDYEQSTVKNIWIIYNNFLQDKIHDISLTPARMYPQNEGASILV